MEFEQYVVEMGNASEITNGPSGVGLEGHPQGPKSPRPRPVHTQQ